MAPHRKKILIKLCIWESFASSGWEGQETPISIALNFNFGSITSSHQSGIPGLIVFSRGLESRCYLCAEIVGGKMVVMLCIAPTCSVDGNSLCLQGYGLYPGTRLGGRYHTSAGLRVIPVGSRHTSGPGLKKFPAFHQLAAQGALGWGKQSW